MQVNLHRIVQAINQKAPGAVQIEEAGKGMTREETRESINPYHQQMNTSDGGEFPDDAIRMSKWPREDPGVKEDNNPQN